MIAIVLAARDHLHEIDDAVAREVVTTIDKWAVRDIGNAQLAGVADEMRRAIKDANARSNGLDDRLLALPTWTAESLADAQRTVRQHVAVFNAGLALCSAAQMAAAGEHARLVAASATTAARYVECAIREGAPVRGAA